MKKNWKQGLNKCSHTKFTAMPFAIAPKHIQTKCPAAG